MAMSKVITVANRGANAWTHAAIQQAVDRAEASGGGVVEVPAGIYRMNNALRLRSGVRVIGETGTVLRKVPSVSSRIPDYLGYGHYEITVEEPEKFRPGMGIHVLDNNAGGFYTTVATIIAIKGDRLFIDRPLNHDYGFQDNARAISVFPLIEAAGVRKASIEKVRLDGNKNREVFQINGCRGGGVFFYQSRDVAARDVEIADYRGDGISFQQCIDVSIEGCRVHDNAGGGLHPGSGSVRYVLRGNRLYDNGGCGIFYCLRTTHSVCRDNVIESNGDIGISIGERDTDHLIAFNVIRHNGGPGVLFREPTRRSGDRVRLQGNAIGPNCRSSGVAEIEIGSRLHDIHVIGNAIESGKNKAMSVGAGCKGIHFDSNTVAGRSQRPEDVGGRRRIVKFAAPASFPRLGPAALPADGARHLFVVKPGRCHLAVCGKK